MKNNAFQCSSCSNTANEEPVSYRRFSGMQPDTRHVMTEIIIVLQSNESRDLNLNNHQNPFPCNTKVENKSNLKSWTNHVTWHVALSADSYYTQPGPYQSSRQANHRPPFSKGPGICSLDRSGCFHASPKYWTNCPESTKFKRKTSVKTTVVRCCWQNSFNMPWNTFCKSLGN